MAEATKIDKVKALFDKAVADGDHARAEGIATAATIFAPEIDFKRRKVDNSAATDFADSQDEAIYQNFLTNSGAEE